MFQLHDDGQLSHGMASLFVAMGDISGNNFGDVNVTAGKSNKRSRLSSTQAHSLNDS